MTLRILDRLLKSGLARVVIPITQDDKGPGHGDIVPCTRQFSASAAECVIEGGAAFGLQGGNPSRQLPGIIGIVLGKIGVVGKADYECAIHFSAHYLLQEPGGGLLFKTKAIMD